MNSIVFFGGQAESNHFLIDVDVEVLLGGVVHDEPQPVLLLGVDESHQTLTKTDVFQPHSGLLSSLGEPLQLHPDSLRDKSQFHLYKPQSVRVYLSGEREELLLKDFHGSLSDNLHFPGVHKLHQEVLVVLGIQQGVQPSHHLSPEPAISNTCSNNLTWERRNLEIVETRTAGW